MKKLILLLFLLQYSYVFTQNSNSTSEIDSLLDLSKSKLRSFELIPTLKYAKEALRLSKKINYSAGIARANYYIANGLVETANYKSALEYLTTSLNEPYTKANPQLTSDIYRVRGRIYGNIGLTDISIQEFKKGIESTYAIPIIENRKFTQILFNENLIFLYKKKQIQDSVKYYLDRNKMILNELNENFIYGGKVNYYNELIQYHLSSNTYDSALIYLEKAIDLATKYKYKPTSLTYELWGNLYQKQNKYDSALHYYSKAIQNANETGLENELPLMYEDIAKIYKSKGDIITAQDYQLKSLKIQQKFAKGKREATEEALKIIIDTKSNQFSKKSYAIVTALSIAFLFLICTIVIYFWKKQKIVYNQLKTKRQLLTEKDEIINQIEEKTQKLKLKINESFEEVVQLARKNSPEFIVRFSEVYPEYYQKLLSLEPKLLKAEVRFCALLYLNFTTKDIADYTFVTVKAVQHRKFRMRKKLNIPSDVNITDWINSN